MIDITISVLSSYTDDYIWKQLVPHIYSIKKKLLQKYLQQKCIALIKQNTKMYIMNYKYNESVPTIYFAKDN